MKLTAKLKLLPTPEQRKLLLETLERANEACNSISQTAWDTQTYRQYDLHKLVYYDVRERFGLSAQMTVRLEAKVADAYKLDRKTQRTFKPHGAISYDSRILSYKDGRVSIWTLQGRQHMNYTTGERQAELMKHQQGESDLVYIRGEFYLLATCDIPEPTPEDVQGYLGIDLGIVQLATDSDGKAHSGEQVNKVRRKHRRLRKSLQKCGSRSAKRKLKRLSGKEARFAKDVNHCLAKSIVETAEHTNRSIALEDLQGIRKGARVRRSQRDDLHSWSFYQLQAFIKYKAALKGINVFKVNPRNTSRTCSVCRHFDKKNRKNQAEFVCQACGVRMNADVNAAVNIAARAEINQPIDSGDVSKSVHVSSQSQAHAL